MHTKRVFIAVVALIVVALTGVLALVLRPGSERNVPVEPATQQAVEPAPSATTTDLERAPTAVDAPGSRTDPTPRVAVEPAKGGIHVVVVDRATNAPIAGATVTFASDAELYTRRDSAHSWIGALEETLTAVGRTTTTDANGDAWVSPSSRPTTVCARHASLWNYREIPLHGEGTLTIELVPDRSLTLQVVDTEGRPQVGVPVAILSTSSQGFTFALWEERTLGPDGSAVVRHLDPLLESVARRQSLSAGFAFLLSSPDDVHLDPANLPSDPIRLVLPPVGAVQVSLEVEARYASSLQGGLAGEVWLENADPRPPRGVYIQKTEARDGRALFTHVGLDMNVVVKAKNVGGFKPSSERAPGPHVDGETVHIAVHFDDPYPTIVGRLLDGEGRPMALRTLQGRTEIQTEDGPVSTATLPTESDADGRVRMVLQVPPMPGLDGKAHIEVFGRDRVLEGHAIVKLPAFLERGDNVVGDMVVDAVERLVAGLVLDQDQQPVPSVWVMVQRGEALDASGSQSAGARDERGSQRADPRNDGTPRTRWLVVPGLQAQTDRDGAFVILGKRPHGPTRVVVNHEAYLRAEGPEFSSGKSDIVIHLAKSGSIEGSVVTPEYFPLDTLSILVTPETNGATVDPRIAKGRVLPLLLDRSFEAVDLPPGNYTVDVSIKGDARPLVSFTDVVVKGGERASDPRLYEIQLSNLLRCFRIDVLDRTGAPVPEASVSVGYGTPQQRSFKVSGKQARVVVRDDPVDLDVSAPGFRPANLRRVSSDRTVVLEPRLPIVLALAPGVRAPEPPFYLGLKFIPLSVSDADVVGSARDAVGSSPGARDRLFDAEGDLWFDEVGTMRLALPAPGSYRLEWSVSYTANGVGAGTTLPTFAHDRIDVPELSGEQYFEVAPDPAQYVRVLNELQTSWGGKK